MDTLILTLALIFLTGIIWARLDSRYAREANPSQSELVVNALARPIAETPSGS